MEENRVAGGRDCIKLNLDAFIYPEAPDSFIEDEAGKLILSCQDLKLPGDISFSIGKLKGAKYEKIDDKHIIKVTTSSDNELFFSISGASRLKSISYAEMINDAILNFDPTAAAAIIKENTDKAESPSLPADKTSENNPNTPAESNDSQNSGDKSKHYAKQHRKPQNEPNKDPLEINLNPPNLDLTPTPPIYMIAKWGYLHVDGEFEEGDNEYRVDLKIQHANLSRDNKVIKYLYITIQAYNRVNDPLGKPGEVKFTGPFKPAESWTSTHTNFIQNSYSMGNIKIVKVDIEYMDNTHIVIKDQKMLDAISSDSAKQLEVEPPKEPRIYMNITWGHYFHNELIPGADNNGNVDLIYYLEKKKETNSIEVTIQPYNNDDKPIGDPKTNIIDISSENVDIIFKKSVTKLFQGIKYSELYYIKVKKIVVYYKHDKNSSITAHHVITDEKMIITTMRKNLANNENTYKNKIKTIIPKTPASIDQKAPPASIDQKEIKNSDDKKPKQIAGCTALTKPDVIIVIIILLVFIFMDVLSNC